MPRERPPGEPPPGGEPPPPEPPNDFGIPGLPPEVAARIHTIFTSGRADAQQQAIAYLMTTSWFHQEYAGYEQGLANGTFSGPLQGGLAQYQQYKTSVNGSYQQHYGRAATAAELAAFLHSGWSANDVGNRAAGHSYQAAHAADVQYASGAFGGGQLTPEELQAYSEQQTGVSTALGTTVQARVEAAMNRINRVFQGQLASSPSADQGLSATLSNQRRPDIQA